MNAEQIVVFVLTAITVAFLVFIELKSRRNRNAAATALPPGHSPAAGSIESPSGLAAKKGD